MIFDGRNSRSICADSCSNYSLSRYCTSVTGKHCTDSKKTSHWEVFLESILLFVSQGGFSLTKAPSFFNPRFGLKKFTRKGAFTDKVFRLLRKAAKGVASGHHHLLKKVDENFCFYFSLTLPTAPAVLHSLQ